MPISLRKINYSYPLRLGNHFHLLIDGDNYYKAALNAIDKARHSILMEQYLVHSGCIADQFIHKLCQATHRGVLVNITLDDYGSANLNSHDREQLQRANVHLQFYNPIHFKHGHHSLFRTHRKMLIVDGQQAFVGGAGIADEFSEEVYGPQSWHDVMLQIQGPIVADWLKLFNKTWQQDSSLKAILRPNDLNPNPHPSDSDQLGRVLVNTPFRQQEINRSLIKHLWRVQERAWITTPYFVASRKIRRALRHTARRKVDVRLLLPGPYSDHPWITYAARRHYMRLLRSGVRIFEYQPRFTHTKIQLCDNWVSTGSSNLDRWNQRWNLDANQAVYDVDFAKQAIELFTINFSVSKEITLAEWRQRPWQTRLKEWFSGQLVYLLERLGRGSKQRSNLSGGRKSN